MKAFEGEFSLSRLERVISGNAKVDTLGDELIRRGLSRGLVITGKTLGASALVQRLAAALGSRLADVFTGARQHVPASTVREVVNAAERTGADCLISFGGGSPIDTTKAAVHALLTSPDDTGIVHIAVPTTLSAGEYSSAAGITDEATRVKRGVSDPRIAPRTVITDPTVTLATPDWLWAATGMRALDHAIESVYSVRHHPFSDALSTAAIRELTAHLPASLNTTGQAQLEHRGHCQLATWMAIFGMTNAGFGLSHALGHQIGPRWDVPHGITSCITLPHAMRFMAQVAPERFGPIAAGFGLPFDPADPQPAAFASADRTADFIASLKLPSRLREADVPKDEMSEVAALVHEAMQRARVVDRPVTREEMQALLEAAY